MNRPFTFSATRRIFLSTLIITGLALLALMWKGVLPGKASSTSPATAASAAMPPMPLPHVSLAVPGMEFPSQVLIGETFCYTARFDNLTGGGVGYGPYVEIILPPGLTLESAGLPGVCNTANCTQDSFYDITPILVSTSVVSPQPPPTHKIYQIKAPIGSLYSSEPFIDLKICVKVDENIALGVPVTVCHTPVFEFGALALGGTELHGTQLCPTVTPTVVILTKRALNYTSNKLPNDPTVELPTGACNKVAFELVANIADTKTLEMIRIEDHLPLGMTLVNNSVTILNATGGSTACTNYGTNFVCAELPTETGTPGMPPYDKEDIIVRFEAYVNNNVLNQASCNSAVIVNTATLDAKYNLLSIPQQTADLKIEAEHVTIQKTASGPDANDPLHVVPGDNVLYKLNFQVSENTTVSNVVITDTIPNGIDLPGPFFFASLQCNGGQISFLQPNNIANNTNDGTKTLTFNFASLGSCANCMLSFTGVVQQKYRMPILDQNVLASDSLIPSCGGPSSPLKCTNINYNINGGASACLDDTAGGVIVEPTRIGKEVVPPIPANGFQPGDLVTFKLKMWVDSGDTQSVEFTDYLPSPIFKVNSTSDISNLMVTQTAGLPVNPTVTASVPGGDNSVKFTIHPTLLTTNTIRADGPVCFEVKFSAYVTYEPFDDNLFLTNIFPSKNVKTNGEEEGHFTGAIIHVRAPKLKVTKGVFDTDNPFADSLSQLPGPQPYNADAQGVDANDTITYYVTVTNDGGAPAVGVSVTDALPAGMKIVSYPMPVGSTPPLTPTCKIGGISQPCPAIGSTILPGTTVNAFFNSNSLPPGQSWIFKIELMLPPNVPPCQTFTNSASATWSSFVQTDVIPAPIYSTQFPETPPDSATITTASPTITKTIVSTSQAHTTGTDVAIGEKVKYLVHIRVPEGTFTGVNVMDTLDSGLAVVDGTVTATASGAVVTGSLSGTIASGGGMISFNLGTVANLNTNNSVEEFIEFMYEAVVLNVTGNVQGKLLNNTVKWTSGQCNPPGVSAIEPVKVVEPKLQVNKTATNAAGEPINSADAGDEITWMITVTNQSPSTAGAFSVLLTDLISNGQSYVANSLMVMGGNNPPTSLSGNSVILTVNWDQFPLNTTCILKFKVIVTSAFSCSPITNQANLSWASIPPPTPNPISPHNSNSCPRTGPPLTSCGQLNNYSTSGTGSVAVPSPTIAKTIKSTSAPHTTGNNVTIGEEIIYELKVGLPEGTTSTLTLTDALPAGLAAISATVVTTNGIGGLPPSFTVATACGAAQTFTFPNPLTVPGDNNTANNFFTVDLKVKVCDGASNTLNNTATLTAANCPPVESSVQVVVVKPNLDIKKQFSSSMAAPNSTVQIIITVNNNGTSPAYELLLQDVLNGCLSYVSGSATQGFTVAQNGGSVTVTGASLDVGSTVTITITAQVGDCCSVPNTATGSATSLPGQVTGEGTVTATGSDTLIVTGTNCPCYNLAQPSALAAWFHFDETSGTTANDIGGPVNNLGTYGAGTAAPVSTAGVVQNALLFDGVNDFVQAANDNELNIRGACNTNDAENYTIDAWIQSDGVGTQTIVDKRVGGTFTGYILFLNNGRLAIQINGQNYATPTTLPVLTDNQPHFIAVTVQRCPTPQAKFYVDGDLVHTATLNASASNSMVNSEPLYIGTRSLSVGSGANFKGKLDELEIFKRVLSEEELDLIYGAGSGGKCKCVPPPQFASMVGWWPMNEFAGDPFASDIRSGNNGVQFPAGAIGSPNVTPITGVVKGAFRFPLSNQSDKYISVADPASNTALDFGLGSFTIECWFRAIAPSTNLVHPIVDKLNVDNNTGYAFYVQNQQLKFVLGGGGLLTFSSTAGVITLNEWQHVGVVVDRGTNTGRFVRNGVTVGTFTPTAGNSDNNSSMFIGGSRITFPPPSFATTDLDELEIFKAALTNEELALLYNAGGMGKCPPACAIIPATLPEAMIGVPYSQQLTLTGCAGTVVWSISGGSLPQGMSLNPTTGVLSGTVTFPTAGNVAITVKATCSTGCMVTKDYLFAWAPCVYVIDPLSANYGSGGGTGTASITTGILCAWTATSNAAWLIVTSGATGSGNGTVGYSVAPNAGAARVGTMTIAGQTFTVMQGCPTIVVNPPTASSGMVGTAYNLAFSATGGTGPYSFTRVTGTLPPGLTLATSGALTGTPTTAGSFNFTVQAMDANGCTGTRAYNNVLISGNGLQFYTLPTPVRLLDTRPGASPNACSQPNAPIAGGTSRTQPARSFCGLPANAQAITGNVTTVNSGGGYLTLYPSGATQPTVASTNYGVNEIINNVFTVGLGAADGAFNIFALNTTDVVVDVTGYYAPPATGGLYFHTLPAPARLLETRAGQPVGCVLPGAPLTGGQDSLQTATTACMGIPATARAIVGNATTVSPQGGGFLTIFPADAIRPVVASSNYNFNQVVNGPFTVGLSATGQFKIFTLATTDLIVDVLGYYSTEATDANSAGLLFTPLGHPVRLVETRSNPANLTGCFKPNAPLNGSQVYTQTARGLCDGLTIPATALGVVGNATVITPLGGGFLTLWPSTAATQPSVATANYNAGQVVNRHFIVGLGSGDGAFKMFSLATTDLVIDLSGYFAP